jgi:tetratricopeptide (TPR) repeat protein
MIRLFCCLLLLLIAGCSRQTASQLVERGFDTAGNKAITLYTKAIQLDNGNVEAHWRRGDEFFKMGQHKQAIADFTQSIAIEPTYNAGYLFGDRGEAFEALNQLPEAIRDYTTALSICRRQLSPSLPTTPMENFYFYRGRARLKAGDTTAAVIDTDSAIHYWDKFIRARYQRGRLEVIQGEYKKAQADYNAATLEPEEAADKELIDDVFYLGLLKFKQQDSTYCAYWTAAARYNQKKAQQYLRKYCSSSNGK